MAVYVNTVNKIMKTLALLLASALILQAADDSSESRKVAADAFYAGQKAVKEHLKSPRDADFSSLYWDKESKVVPYGYQQYLVAGWVDSRNSFGAKLRSDWAAVVELDGDNTVVSYMEIGGSKYGKLPAIKKRPLTDTEKDELKKNAEAAKAASDAKKQADKKVMDEKILAANQKAADQGDAYGLLRMGQRYRDGDGVEKDLDKARNYLRQAALKGSETAKKELDQLLK